MPINIFWFLFWNTRVWDTARVRTAWYLNRCITTGHRQRPQYPRLGAAKPRGASRGHDPRLPRRLGYGRGRDDRAPPRRQTVSHAGDLPADAAVRDARLSACADADAAKGTCLFQGKLPELNDRMTERKLLEAEHWHSSRLGHHEFWTVLTKPPTV